MVKKESIMTGLIGLVVIGLTISTTAHAAAVDRRSAANPTFILQDVTLYTFNVTRTKSDTFLNTTLQVTISAHNPNRLTGIEHDLLGVYASYRGMQITMFGDLAQGYMGPKKGTVWAPLVLSYDGAALPVSREMGRAVGRDIRAGLVAMNVTVNGRMRWKVGSTWRSKKYFLAVDCPAYLRFSDGKSGGAGKGVKYQLDQACSVKLST